jgi:hypothetical protein
LKEAADSLFPPGLSELEEEEIDNGSSETTVAEDEDLPADDDSGDGGYKYEELSQYSSEDVEWGPEKEWEIVTRRYEEVEELDRRYIAWEDRQRKNVSWP